MDKKKVIIIVTAATLIIAAAAIIFAAKGMQKADNSSASQNVTSSVTDKADKEKKSEEKTEKTEKTEKKSEEKTEKNSEKQEEKKSNSAAKSTEEVKVTPTFMYFISATDENYENTNAMIEELKKQYDGKIKFDIVNVDENPDAKKNFPVDGQTPALIMLNTSNDISALEFKCNDKDTLVKDIENALK